MGNFIKKLTEVTNKFENNRRKSMKSQKKLQYALEKQENHQEKINEIERKFD